ncbi:cytochrome P450 [Naematelia encephala]|uniref:Cytochrome P450 n=1 Tax=Naematelia encephala TaxID=71784 RepID=A0A1Y2BAY0_9TREE|nr:cytochrome P450 [Naematelia encephala]
MFFSFLLLLPLALVLRRLFYHLRPTETYGGVQRPPFLPDWIPWVGVALSMAGGDSFFCNVQKKYGPCVRLTAMGDTRIFITSPALITYIYKNPKAFVFEYKRRSIQSLVFGMTHTVAFSQAMSDRLFPDHHRALQLVNIGELIQKYTTQLEELVLSKVDEADGAEVDLFEMVYEIIYTASAKAFFTPSFPARTTFKPFIAFDRAFPILNLARLPITMRSQAISAREKILTMLEEWWETTTELDRAAMAPAVCVQWEIAKDEGWSKRDWATVLLAETWALEANAPFAGLWTVIEVLRRPQVLASLRAEVSSTISKLDPPEISTLMHLSQPELITLLPLLNLALQETLRVHSSSFSIRVAEYDTTFPAAVCEGRELSVKKGEEIICVTRPGNIDTTGAWGTDAEIWDTERWIGDDADDEKGKARGPMFPFGGGSSMCEGRHFASAEILSFLAIFIATIDVQVVRDTIKADFTRIGLGVMQPKGELRVKMRRRQGESKVAA